MTQEYKQLLLKDLCARLPYGVKVWRQDADEPQTLDTIYTDSGIRCQCDDDDEDYVPFENVKPYLRPLSSMTEEEKETYEMFFNEEGLLNTSIDTYLEWLLEGHFDFRGLIPKGLAIAVTEENNPYVAK